MLGVNERLAQTVKDDPDYIGFWDPLVVTRKRKRGEERPAKSPAAQKRKKAV